MLELLRMTGGLKNLLDRAKEWPEAAQQELVELGLEIEGEITGNYHASAEELRGIDRGIKAANAGKFATVSQVEKVLAKFRVA